MALPTQHVVVEYIVHIVHKLCCILTVNYTLYLFIEHNGDVTLINYSRFKSKLIFITYKYPKRMRWTGHVVRMDDSRIRK
jgi:hypothetical protein